MKINNYYIPDYLFNPSNPKGNIDEAIYDKLNRYRRLINITEEMDEGDILNLMAETAYIDSFSLYGDNTSWEDM